MRQSIKILWRVIATISFIFSATCIFLGVAPEKAIAFIIGPKWTAYFLYFRSQVLGISADQARWIFVVLGDVLFAVAIFLFLFVYYANRIAKTYATAGEVNEFEFKMKSKISETESKLLDKVQLLEAKLRESEEAVGAQLADAKRRERRAQKLHDAAYKMLQKIHREKKG